MSKLSASINTAWISSRICDSSRIVVKPPSEDPPELTESDIDVNESDAAESDEGRTESAESAEAPGRTDQR